MTSPAVQPLVARWSVAQAAAALGGSVDSAFADRPFAPVSTDSRAIAAGEFFLALSGENFDGHKFIPGALERGAAGLIVGRDYAPPAPLAVPVIHVADPLRAYGDLAAALRREWAGPVLAISGSAGKTTTRRLVSAALARRYAVLEPLRNFNNLIGVPHTLLRLEPRHEIAVMELGMNLPGELLRLAQIAQPSAALMTFIGRAHVGMFASEADLVQAKLDLFRGCPPGIPLAVNAACANTLRALPEFTAGANASRRIVQFLGDRPAAALPNAAPEVRITRVRALAPVGYRFDLVTPHGTLPDLALHMFGRHHLEDVAAAAALLLAAGLDPALIPPALEDFHTEALRGQIVDAGGMTFLLDCYNAAPDSMLAALHSLADLPRPARLVLVLADMRELGDLSETLHAQLLAPLRSLAPDAVYGLGPYTAEVCAALAAEGTSAAAFDSRDALVEALRRELREGDLVFFKGSHGFRLELAAAALVPALAEQLAEHLN